MTIHSFIIHSFVYCNKCQNASLRAVQDFHV